MSFFEVIYIKKDQRLEYLRVFSCLFVVLGHIANWYMREYPNLAMSSYIYSLIFNGICRVSVPIFFMISGAIFLERPIDYEKTVKRTSDILIKTVVWTFVFVIWDYFYLGQSYSFQLAFSVPVRPHFWFMYVMVGIYATLPLWQKLVSGEPKKLLYYFFQLFIGVLTVTFILKLVKMDITYEIPLVGNCCYVCYFIMGYVIRHYIDDIKIKKRYCFALILLCVTATTVLTFYFSTRFNKHLETFSDFRTVFIAVASLCVFYLAMKIKSLPQNRFVLALSKHSFNIYMFHVFFLDILQQNIALQDIGAWLGFPIFLVFLISLSFASSWLYEKAKGKCRFI